MNEPSLTIAKTALREAEVGHDGRLVTVQARHWSRSSPCTLQRRPGNEIRLDAFPTEARPSAGRCRPIVRFLLVSPMPLFPIPIQPENIQRPKWGKSFPVQEVVAGLRGDGFFLAVPDDNLDLRASQPMRFEEGP